MPFSLSPELVWGLIPRVLGLIYVLAFGCLIPQHDVMAGSHGLASIDALRRRLDRDFPGPAKFFGVPSTLWLADSDTAQRAMAVVGTLCGVVAMYGGPWSFYALLVAWIFWLSLEPRGLVFPWDTMLEEIGFLALFLPSVAALPTLEATALPLPSVAFMVRWLLLRLMLGFAKEKFFNTGKKEFLYLQGFMVWMPLPTRLGWLAHHAPTWLLRFALLFMFVAECVAPVLGLFSGPLRVVAFGLLVSLMAGIHATGNWGFFNIGYALLCICLLDTQSSIFDLGHEPWASRLTTWPDVAVHGVMALMFLVSLFYLVVTNSWLTRSWVNWSPHLFALSPAQQKWYWRLYYVFSPLRVLAPFRIVNGFGVFPPKSLPPVRMMPVIEGSADGVTWKQYGYRFMPSFPSSRPPFVAPYHPRLDMYVAYIPLGTDTGSYMGSMAPFSNPYMIAGRSSLMHLILQRVLAGDPKVLRKLGHNPFPDAPPKLIRLGVIAMTPTPLSERKKTGNWWHVERLGTLFPATGLVSWPDTMLIPEPELFHPDLVMWKARAAPLRAITRAAARNEPADQAIIAESDLTSDDVNAFWRDFVPMLVEGRGDWSRAHERASALSTRFGIEGIQRHERVLERYAWLLRNVTEKHFQGTAEPALPKLNNFQYWMLLHEVIVDGHDAVQRVLDEPACIVERLARSTQATQLWALGLIRYEQIWVHIRCFRQFDAGFDGVPNLPSFLAYHGFLSSLVPPDEEFRLQAHKHDNGEFTIDNFYPRPVA